MTLINKNNKLNHKENILNKDEKISCIKLVQIKIIIKTKIEEVCNKNKKNGEKKQI